MHIDSFFACSNSSLEEAEVVLFGIPYDATQSFKPGSRFAPTAIREASWNLEDFSVYFRRGVGVRFCDAGNVCVDGSFEDIIFETELFLKKLAHKKFIMLGGEHTVSYAVSRALDKTHFVVFDAHFDLRDEFDGSKYNHACTVRRIAEKHDVTLIGVRSSTKEEIEFAEEMGIRYYTSFEVAERWGKILEELESELPEKFYLSVDMDAFDPSFAPGVSTPEPFGIEPVKYLEFLKKFGNRIEGMDIVEVIPDSERITPTLAAKFVVEFLCFLST